MPGHALPAPFAIHVHIGEAHSRHDLALRVDGRCQSPDVAEFAVDMRAQIREFVMHGRMFARLLPGWWRGRSACHRVQRPRTRPPECSSELLCPVAPGREPMSARYESTRRYSAAWPVGHGPATARRQSNNEAQCVFHAHSSGHRPTDHHTPGQRLTPATATAVRIQVCNPKSAEALPEVAGPFLYTNSPGQLHYTLAFFRIAVGKTYDVRSCGGPKPEPAGIEGCDCRNRRTEFKSNRGKRGDTWQPLTKR